MLDPAFNYEPYTGLPLYGNSKPRKIYPISEEEIKLIY
jgi:hypothetical protein